MFSRAAVNPMEDSVTKATNENLTSENWELILAVCDKVDADPENGARNAIAAISKRLGHRNANVQLFSLSLADALSKNCGSKAHREIASRSFMQAILRLVSDRAIHEKVKSKTAELVAHWADEFKRDPSLGLVGETNNSIKSMGISVPAAPSRPQKREITDADRRHEEEELQIALAMSLKEVRSSPGAGRTAESSIQRQPEVDNSPNAYTLPNASANYTLPTASTTHNNLPNNSQLNPIADRTAATVSRVRALYDFSASEAGELSFRRGDVIQVIESAYKDWWRGSLHGNIGIFPTNYVENLADPTAADLQREAEEEQRVFAEAKNVEKLLSILSSADSHDPKLADNEQLQDLYHSTISIRPKLVRLIEKYAQKKDDLISLNEKFMRARKDYDELMEASLSRYNTSPYTARNSSDPRQGSYQSYRPGGAPQAADYPRPQYSGEPRGSAPGMSNGYQRQASSADYHQKPQHSGQFRGSPAPQQYAQSPYPPQQHRMSSEQLDNRRASQHTGYSQPDGQYGAQHASPRINSANGAQQEHQSLFDTTDEPVNSAHQVPSSPSQDLAQLHFTERPDTSTYDHQRAELEGGPPISYYSEGIDAAVSNAPQHTPNLLPSAPGYVETEEEIPDYYRRA